MKWVIIAIAVLIGLIALVTVVGMLLPKQHVAKRSAKFNQPPQAIWDAISNFEALPSWRPEVQTVEKQPDRNGHPVWVEATNMEKFSYEVTFFESPTKMVTVIADTTLPFGGSWTYEILEDEAGSQLTITEAGEIYNPIFRFMARFIFGYHATMETYLRNLGKKFGEETLIIKPAI
jgi:hypothetical protein